MRGERVGVSCEAREERSVQVHVNVEVTGRREYTAPSSPLEERPLSMLPPQATKARFQVGLARGRERGGTHSTRCVPKETEITPSSPRAQEGRQVGRQVTLCNAVWGCGSRSQDSG